VSDFISDKEVTENDDLSEEDNAKKNGNKKRNKDSILTNSTDDVNLHKKQNTGKA
jgi:hypothetical protein